MADESLYDEFGNYIGPELSDSDQVRVHAGHGARQGQWWAPGSSARCCRRLLHCAVPSRPDLLTLHCAAAAGRRGSG
jgi:hypothetical protein